MAGQSGSFFGPDVTPSVAYAAGATVTFGLVGEWPRAAINAEVSIDSGATWQPYGLDFGLQGASLADSASFRAPGAVRCNPPGPGMFRLRCVEFRSGWCNWTIST